MKLQKIDELILRDHSYLTESDNCFFLAEYTSRKKYDFSNTNQLIYNLKKSLEKKNTNEWEYKRKAIKTCGKLISGIFANKNISPYVFVPIPPSKCKTDPLYDDRLVKILEFANNQKQTLNNFNIKELILQENSIPSFHNINNDTRPDPLSLMAQYKIDQSILDFKPKKFIIFDDLITTGCHFKAVKWMLQEAYPDAKIFGVFIARRIFAEEND
ncbi:hypothetical protein ABXR98_02900 [Snodgrassella alvi]|uniref:hypothetical protein n=1 Tax=Snodgrassella alvi TaxID=1196083 RepID=UPI0035B3896E